MTQNSSKELGSPKKQASEHLKTADKLLKSNDLKGAMQEIEKALIVDPGNVYALAYKQRVQTEIDDFAKRRVVPSPQKAEPPTEMKEPERQSVVQPAERRKLAALMLTDMVGFSALTQQNEQLALQLLEEHRILLRPMFSHFCGTEIKTIGDAFIVEFESVVQAVNCALAIHNKLDEYNKQASEERKIRLRIGIHIGDIIYRESDIYGDGVNIATRIQEMAEPEGICISQDVYNLIRTHGEYQIEPIGEVTLKNIATPLLLYKVLTPIQQFKKYEAEAIRMAKEDGKMEARKGKIQEYLVRTREFLNQSLFENAYIELMKVYALEPNNFEAKSLEESIKQKKIEERRMKVEEARKLPHSLSIESYQRILQFVLGEEGDELLPEEESLLKEFRTAYNITEEEHRNLENIIQSGF